MREVAVAEAQRSAKLQRGRVQDPNLRWLARIVHRLADCQQPVVSARLDDCTEPSKLTRRSTVQLFGSTTTSPPSPRSSTAPSAPSRSRVPSRVQPAAHTGSCWPA